jgi:hypothetical protein
MPPGCQACRCPEWTSLRVVRSLETMHTCSGTTSGLRSLRLAGLRLRTLGSGKPYGGTCLNDWSRVLAKTGARMLKSALRLRLQHNCRAQRCMRTRYRQVMGRLTHAATSLVSGLHCWSFGGLRCVSSLAQGGQPGSVTGLLHKVNQGRLSFTVGFREGGFNLYTRALCAVLSTTYLRDKSSRTCQAGHLDDIHIDQL